MDRSRVMSLLCGLASAWAMTALLTVIGAFVFYKFHVTSEKARLFILAIYVIGNGVGGFVSGKIAKTGKFIMGFLSGLCYVLILLVAALVIGKGEIQGVMGVLITAMLCCGGGMLGGMSGNLRSR